MQKVEYRKTPATLPAELDRMLPASLLAAIEYAGSERVEEIRLYRDRYATLTVGGKTLPTKTLLSGEALDALFSDLCGGSVYAHKETIKAGYLSLGEGVRVGISGRALCDGGRVHGVTDLSGLVIRIPHPLWIDVTELLPYAKKGLLIYAPPGVGKTTLLRCLAYELAKTGRTVLLDRRGEFIGTIPQKDLQLQLLTNFPEAVGMEVAVRNLGAEVILADEIGNEEEAKAILALANCGVPLVASAHAASAEELCRRPPIKRLLEAAVFERVVGLARPSFGRFSFTVSEGVIS